MKKFILIILILVFQSTCQKEASKEMKPSQQKETADSIRLHFQKTANNPKLDRKAWISLFSENNDNIWVGEPALITTLNATLSTNKEIDNGFNWLFDKEGKSHLYDNGNGDSQYITIEEDYVAVVSSEQVVYIFQGYLNGFYNEEGQYKPKACGTLVYMRKSKEWKLLHSHLSFESHPIF